MSDGGHEPDDPAPANFNKLQIEAMMSEIIKRLKTNNFVNENTDNFLGHMSQARKHARTKGGANGWPQERLMIEIPPLVIVLMKNGR